MYKCIHLQTSVAHVRTHLLPERAKQAGSKTMIGSVCHQVGQALSARREVTGTVGEQTDRKLGTYANYRMIAERNEDI